MSKKKTYTSEGQWFVVMLDNLKHGMTYAEVMVYSYIHSYVSAGNVFRASNDHLAVVFETSVGSISNIISSLERKGFVIRTVKKTKNGTYRKLETVDKMEEMRKIRESHHDDYVDNYVETHSTNNGYPLQKKCSAHYVYNREEYIYAPNDEIEEPAKVETERFNEANQQSNQPEQSGALSTEQSGGDRIQAATSAQLPSESFPKTESAQIDFSSAFSNPPNAVTKSIVGAAAFFTKNGTWSPDAAFVASLKDAYPQVDVDAELKKARLWCEANPSKRKTPRGMKKFITSWIANATKPKQWSNQPVDMATWKPTVEMPKNWRPRLTKLLSEAESLGYSQRAIDKFREMLSRKESDMTQDDQKLITEMEQDGQL